MVCKSKGKTLYEQERKKSAFYLVKNIEAPLLYNFTGRTDGTVKCHKLGISEEMVVSLVLELVQFYGPQIISIFKNKNGTINTSLRSERGKLSSEKTTTPPAQVTCPVGYFVPRHFIRIKVEAS